MRKFLFICLLMVGCGGAEPDAEVTSAPGAATAGIPASLNIPGNIQNKDIAEASGLAASRRRGDLLWTHNDSGAKARIYALGLAGESLGRARVRNVDNVDWEDIAAFVLDNTAYLLIADVGDNDSKRDSVILYVVEEPDLEGDNKPEIEPAWQIQLRYPGGPRDVEAVAVDIDNEQVLLLSKRTLPPELYAVALRPTSDDMQVAELLGQIDSLPQPSQRDIDFAPRTDDWFWQPTGMDIASDGSAIAIVTYHPAVYLYFRDGDWQSTLQNPPLRFTLRRSLNPESVAFSAGNRSLFVTIEKRHAALMRIDFEGESE